jgi:hypothetical protein
MYGYSLGQKIKCNMAILLFQNLGAFGRLDYALLMIDET